MAKAAAPFAETPRHQPRSSAMAAARTRRARGPIVVAAIGLVLIGAALWLRSSPWMRDISLRGKSTAQLEAIVQARPDDAMAQYYLAKHHYVERRYADARAAYEQAVRLDPGSARAHLGLGLTLGQLGDPQGARRELEQTLKLDNQSGWAEYTLGKIAWESGDLEEALPHLRRATQLDPRSPDAWYGLGVTATRLHDYDEAMKALRRAVVLQDGSARYHAALAQVLVYRGFLDEGRAHYERALQVNPNYGPACALMGQLLLQKVPGSESLARAEELLKRATHLKTRHPDEVYLNLGQLYMQKGSYAEAASALEQSIRIDPRDERAYYNLGIAYRRMGQESKAKEIEARFQRISAMHVRMQNLQARISHNGTDADTRLELARLYRDLGMLTDAAGEYQNVLQLRNDRAVAAELTKMLREARSQPQSAEHELAMPALSGSADGH